MNRSRSRGLVLVACAAFALATGAVSAQPFPSKPLEFIVHTSPGGGTDVFARAVSEMLTREKLIVQPIQVVNRVGGGGNIAFTYIKSKAAIRTRYSRSQPAVCSLRPREPSSGSVSRITRYSRSSRWIRRSSRSRPIRSSKASRSSSRSGAGSRIH